MKLPIDIANAATHTCAAAAVRHLADAAKALAHASQCLRDAQSVPTAMIGALAAPHARPALNAASVALTQHYECTCRALSDRLGDAVRDLQRRLAADAARADAAVANVD